MSYWDDFDCEVQPEEIYKPMLSLGDGDIMSEDIMDRCEVVSLDCLDIKPGSYCMEDAIIEADELDWLWDTREAHNSLKELFSLRKVGVQ